MKSVTFLFPGGRPKALAMSYDDGVKEDRRLVEIFNAYGIKGTFHLNAGFLGRETHLEAAEVKSLYAGHEISCHSWSHPFLERSPAISVLKEVLEDRKALETLAGRPVRGMSYPMGTYNPEVMRILGSAGIAYSRTIRATGKFGLPEDWLEWHPTCHHRDNLPEIGEAFRKTHHSFALLSVWGHSYEFARNNNWELIESFCESMTKNDSVWYATCIEIYNYVTALRRLEFSADGELVYNPSVLPVCLRVDGEPVRIGSGELKEL